MVRQRSHARPWSPAARWKPHARRRRQHAPLSTRWQIVAPGDPGQIALPDPARIPELGLSVGSASLEVTRARLDDFTYGTLAYSRPIRAQLGCPRHRHGPGALRVTCARPSLEALASLASRAGFRAVSARLARSRGSDVVLRPRRSLALRRRASGHHHLHGRRPSGAASNSSECVVGDAGPDFRVIETAPSAASCARRRLATLHRMPTRSKRDATDSTWKSARESGEGYEKSRTCTGEGIACRAGGCVGLCAGRVGTAQQRRLRVLGGRSRQREHRLHAQRRGASSSRSSSATRSPTSPAERDDRAGRQRPGRARRRRRGRAQSIAPLQPAGLPARPARGRRISPRASSTPAPHTALTRTPRTASARRARSSPTSSTRSRTSTCSPTTPRCSSRSRRSADGEHGSNRVRRRSAGRRRSRAPTIPTPTSIPRTRSTCAPS